MKSKSILRGISVAIIALQLGVLAGSAQTGIYLVSGSETNITLNQGTYIITAYGAPGGSGGGSEGRGGGGFVVEGFTPLVVAHVNIWHGGQQICYGGDRRGPDSRS